MHAGKSYRLGEFLAWTKRDIFWLVVLAVVPTALYVFAGWHWLAIPWVPITMLGTAAAFIAGFRNNATYNRLWEARQIWGSIVNSSRTWGIMARDFISTESPLTDREIHHQMIYRHIAWMTALRFQLREKKTWENHDAGAFKDYRRNYRVEEEETELADVLPNFVSKVETDFIMARKNKAAQIISMQSAQLRALADAGSVSEFRYTQLEGVLKELYDHQGRCERIKNFPYPRQFSTISNFFIRLFVFMLPLGMLNEFSKHGEKMIWMAVPFSIIVSWVFTTLERVGQATENPFEGGANDVPITAMSRNIEIDLREMLGETELPPPVQPVNRILM